MIEVQDRSEINKQLSTENFFPPFLSVLLPELGRPEYLKKCVESIHRHADIPVEIIVHDDGSGKEKQRFLFEQLRDQVSTFVFNTGHNTGLARSFNRCRAMSSSPYLVGMNTDTYLTSPFFQRIKTALDLPYVGTVIPTQKIAEGSGVYVAPDGTKIQLLTNMGHSHCFGVRREVWDKVQGWNENVQSASSDVGFFSSIFSLGLFGVAVEGTVINEMWPVAADGLTNEGYSNPDYVAATDFARVDLNTPPIFKMSTELHDVLCGNRYAAAWLGLNQFLNADPLFPTWHNHAFFCSVVEKVFRSSNKINWDAAKECGFGHDRWRDRMISDFNLEV